jgi:hypothetical protein
MSAHIAACAATSGAAIQSCRKVSIRGLSGQPNQALAPLVRKPRCSPGSSALLSPVTKMLQPPLSSGSRRGAHAAGRSAARAAPDLGQLLPDQERRAHRAGRHRFRPGPAGRRFPAGQSGGGRRDARRDRCGAADPYASRSLGRSCGQARRCDLSARGTCDACGRSCLLARRQCNDAGRGPRAPADVLRRRPRASRSIASGCGCSPVARCFRA